MIKPRNTLVVVKLMDKKEEQIGNIVVPDHENLYTEAEVIAIGPGTVSAEGGVSETFDLVKGQRVLVKYKQLHPQLGTTLAGIKYTDSGQLFYIFEQTSIVGIVADPA